MAFFRGPGHKLLQTMRDGLCVRTFKKDLFQIAASNISKSTSLSPGRIYQFKPNKFEIIAHVREYPSKSNELHPENDELSRLMFETKCVAIKPTVEPMTPLAESVNLNWSLSLREVPLIFAADLAPRQLSISDFVVAVKRFSFPPWDREITNLEGHGLFSPMSASPVSRDKFQTLSARLQPVKPPEPPPSLQSAGLQERLLWLLTPPISEILADPYLALPDLPFCYQQEGIKWLSDRQNALLADEMGLGKTMQAILGANLLYRRGLVNQILIVCPKPLVSNWKRELQHWWPGIGSYTRLVTGDRQKFLRDNPRNSVVKIINYEKLAREVDWLKKEHENGTPVYHDLIIIDEAQRIKNAAKPTAQAVKSLGACWKWALTGTPLENSIGDLVSIFGFVKPKLLSDSERDKNKVSKLTKPYMLRRKQNDGLVDLPPKIEQDIEIELGDLQRETYDRAEREGIIELNQKGDSISIPNIFALINKLRQICNFDPVSGESAKAEFLLEELEEIVQADHKALVCLQFVEEPFGLKRLAKVIAQNAIFEGREATLLQLHGGVSQEQRDAAVNRFQNDKKSHIMLLNYAVGGVGLNLQEASYVFLFDRWWNPAVEDQAIGRADRIGRKRKLFVQRLYCKDTIEARMIDILKAKRRLFSDVIDADRPAANIGLTEEEIFSLFNLKARPTRPNTAKSVPQKILENLDDKEFEILVGAIYEKEGYTVEVTGRSHDGGVDIWAERIAAGGNDLVVVQCKHWKTRPVGRPELQQLWGVVSSHATVTHGVLVTSNGFSKEAHDFARDKRLTLIDRTGLKELAQKHGIAEFK